MCKAMATKPARIETGWFLLGPPKRVSTLQPPSTSWGESESGLNERLDALIERLEAAGNPTLAFLASGWEGLKVRLTAKAVDVGAANVLLDQWDGEVRRELGSLVFGVDDDTMESVVLSMLGARGLSTFKSLLLGSVSHGVAQHSHHPMLIVPPAERAEESASG